MDRPREALRLEAVSVWLAGRRLFGPLSLRVEPGEVVTVMGPSGSGKSTLLAFVTGTLDAAFLAQGRVLLGDDEVGALPTEHRRIGIQFQDDLLFPHLSVGGNLAFGLAASLRGRGARRAAVEQALVDAGLAGFAERDPATLSGGQRARVALMRTLLAGPRALLLDEPFNRLDAQLRGDFRRFVLDHVARAGLPALMVTHDADDARAAGGRILRIGQA
jgi:putative thiamine transport system ATP-binding protein